MTATATCVSTTPTRKRKASSTSTRSDATSSGSVSNGTDNPFASDYFDQLYEYAIDLIKQGKAYVDSQNAEDMRANRGTLKQPGVDSPYRDRSIEENLALFEAMKNDEFADGEHVLRAKIDMQSPNINMRDPVLYRIRHVNHHNTGDKWCIYPLYDFTHGLSDAIEGITHSLCTLEFEDHRPLYDWILDNLETPSRPEQTEFARLQLEFSLTSKRKLNQLVSEGLVDGWDDPRMLTISGMRRRGFTPESIVNFCDMIGVTKKDSTIEMGVLETALRDDLNARAVRRMAVINPLKVVIENYPEDQEEFFSGANHPQNPDYGTREVPFLARNLHRARRFHGRRAAQVLSPESRPRGAPAFRLLHHLQGSHQKRRRRNRIPDLHLRPRLAAAAAAPTGARSRAPFTGSARATRWTQRSISTTGCSPRPTRAPRRRSPGAQPGIAGRHA